MSWEHPDSNGQSEPRRKNDHDQVPLLMCTSYASCMARQQAKSLKFRNVSQEHVYSLVVHTTVFFLKCPPVGWASIFLLATRLPFLGSQLNSEYHGCVTKKCNQFWRVLYRRKRAWECTCLYSEWSEFVTFFYKQIASKEVVGRLRGLSNCLLRSWCVMQMVKMRVCASQPWEA